MIDWLGRQKKNFIGMSRLFESTWARHGVCLLRPGTALKIPHGSLVMHSGKRRLADRCTNDSVLDTF